jgi:hypothetical protein
MTMLEVRPPVRPMPLNTGSRTVSSAVVWIDQRHAYVARMSPEGLIETQTLDLGTDDETLDLARVVHAIGDHARVVILGPDNARLALEREYVTIYHRPERLVDVEPAGPIEETDLVDRLRELAG